MDKNIFIINQYACAPKYKAGVGERHFYLAKFFNRYQYNTTIVSSSYNHLINEYPQTSGVITDEMIDGVRFKWVKIKPYPKESAFGRVRSWFEFLVKLFFIHHSGQNPPHIVIVSTMSLFPLLYGCFLKLRYKAKLIHEVRDIWPLTAIELGGYSKYHPLLLLMAWVEKIGFKKSDAVVSVLAGYPEYLKNRFGKSHKLFRWIPNGIDETSTLEAIPEVISSQIPDDKFIVIYTGSIGKANAMQYFVEAAIQLVEESSIHFLVVGEGEEKTKLMSLCKQAENITFLGKVDKPIVLSLIAKSDLCYIGWNNRNLYSYGVSANKYNDYMLMKKPILSSINSQFDPVSIANCGLVVKAEDVEDIVDGIRKLFHTSEQERMELGANGYAYLKNNNLMDVLSKKYVEVFQGLTS